MHETNLHNKKVSQSVENIVRNVNKWLANL